MDFIEVKIKCLEPFVEMLIAEMGMLDYNSFIEIEDGFNAYIEENLFVENELKEIINRYPEAQATFAIEVQPKVNWNEEWEKHYDPIDVNGRCYIRASFHEPKNNYELDIVINPKMSFGTGHHNTTWQMINHQLDIDHQGKRVLDVGCGTAILAIAAAKKGASYIEGFDIDEWSVENSIENTNLNGFDKIIIKKGTIQEINPQGPFDIILANINRNVLLSEISIYSALMPKGGLLLLSGFYEHDIADIQAFAEQNGLILNRKSIKDKWAALVLEKQ